MFRKSISITEDRTAKAPALVHRPIHNAPDPSCSSCGWCVHWGWDCPHSRFGLGPMDVGPATRRSRSSPSPRVGPWTSAAALPRMNNVRSLLLPYFFPGPRYVVQIGEKLIDYNEDFRLFMATRNPTPFIPPDVASVMTEVNFTTTRAGLRGQLLALTIQQEKPELETEKNRLLQMEEENKIQLTLLEETLLEEETLSRTRLMEGEPPADGRLGRERGEEEENRQQKPTKEEEPEGLSWKDKPMHGMYHRQIEEVADIEKTYQWLTKAGLKDSTEALIMAAQEQALSTRAIEARVYHTRQDPRCRLWRCP
ncbi:Cytoplasmic dynein 2 heavy chain 1 [Takifugu flavidus]|uniref:Cytoplasmic dynein 2 heavy chain 1 n=1 Tax=Takifugu flavidus TaxID=433684 RepID=A0A5C6PFF5_9TELE|nr:Cytoplasmic dynein 2 heavy chain 1 [Takifugu flavidus]